MIYVLRTVLSVPRSFRNRSHMPNQIKSWEMRREHSRDCGRLLPQIVCSISFCKPQVTHPLLLIVPVEFILFSFAKKEQLLIV